jgi:glyceraldehyde 3-phosphate dehydrogenase
MIVMQLSFLKMENIVLYIWYDNEYGYSHRNSIGYIAKVRRFTYY